MLGGSVVFILLFLLHHYSECSPRIDPLVYSDVGLIRGLRADDGDYAMFLGVPYAQVDQDNPFGGATPQPKFKETFEAYHDTAICPQEYAQNKTILGTADCLHLNIYVPTKASTNNKVPVMVYFYGGSFQYGSFGRDLYGPKYLVHHDVIVVIMNYRVGAYGFMCLDSPKIPGNQGLKDQFLGIKWVKDNIEAFGGDADKITLFGASAGAHSVEFHLLSDKETLYNNVILQSGSSLAATVLYEPDKLAHIKIAEYLGLLTTDTDEAISFLAKSDSNLVVAAAKDLNIIFKPCVETEFDGVEPFISHSWINADIPKIKNMPVMIGFRKNEMLKSHFNKDDDYYKNLDIVSEYVERIFDFEGEELEEVKNLIMHFYFGDETISKHTKWDLINFDSDFTYIHPEQRSIRKYLDAKAGKIFYFMFSYLGGRNDVIVYDEQEDNSNSTIVCCAAHSDEINYLFSRVHKPDPTTKDELMSEQLTTMWTNFAKYSDPTPQTNELLQVKWEPLTKDAYTYMNIGAELTLGSRPAHDRMAFWDLFYKVNEKRQRAYANH